MLGWRRIGRRGCGVGQLVAVTLARSLSNYPGFARSVSSSEPGVLTVAAGGLGRSARWAPVTSVASEVIRLCSMAFCSSRMLPGQGCRRRSSQASPATWKSWTPTAGLFQAELDLALAQRNELAGFVNLYKALGGGWQAAAQG